MIKKCVFCGRFFDLPYGTPSVLGDYCIECLIDHPEEILAKLAQQRQEIAAEGEKGERMNDTCPNCGSGRYQRRPGIRICMHCGTARLSGYGDGKIAQNENSTNDEVTE